MTYSTLKTDQELFAMEITADKNTWSNSRKKRRQEKIKQMHSNDANISEKPTSDCAKAEENNEIIATKSKDSMEIDADEVSECNVLDAVSNMKETIINQNDSQVSNGNQDGKNRVEKNYNKRKSTDDDEEVSSVSNAKKPKLENSSPQSTSSLKRDAFLCCSLIVKDDPKGSLVEVGWLGGSGGREAAHQVLHYFKNNLKTH